MSWDAGVDGCRAGWFRVCRNASTGELRFDVLGDAQALLTTPPEPEILAVDIPIGLPAAGIRACDVAARRLLGPRRSSVFPPPVRSALEASSREEASERSQRICGRRLGVQTWAIGPKIREVDALLRGSALARARFWEVHPEVSFRAWSGGQPMAHAKRRSAGHDARRRLAEAWLGQGILGGARGPRQRKHLADDDILDAIAALWTAARIRAHRHETLPPGPEVDELGLPMRIVY